jgi:hypothetical protein
MTIGYLYDLHNIIYIEKMSSRKQTTLQKRSKITNNSSPNVREQEEENLNQSPTIKKETNDESDIDLDKTADENISPIGKEIKIKIETNPVTISETVEDVLEDNEKESSGKFEFITFFITCKYNIQH